MQGRERLSKDKNFKTLKVFITTDNLFGLPIKVFVTGLVLTITITFMLHWIPGILFGSVFFYGMYSIHEKDEKGFEVWRKALVRSYHNKTGQWDTALSKSTRLIIFKRNDGYSYEK
jgi:type IV secretory pathway VirB3-like protein